MSEGLEELKKLGDEYPSEGDTLWAQYSERFSIIEKELKEGEMEHTLRVRLENINYELVREKQENEKKLKALNEIVALHDKWLGNRMSDFEFFTLLNDIKYKYGLENEVLK